MKIGFIFECGPDGPDVQAYRHLVYKLDPTIEFIPCTLDNKKKLVEDCEAFDKIFTQELGPRRRYVDYRHALLVAREIADFRRIRRSDSFKRFALKVAGMEL